jgi:thiosulfate/3-mercaptopyruvate sulfurtransferase
VNVRFADCRYDLLDPPSARGRYLEAHIPGAAFVDLDEDLSDLSIPAETAGRHPLPGAMQFAEAMERAGIGDDTLVVAYDEGMSGGAARLWWLLRHFGHDRAAVLDGGLQSWIGPLVSGEEEIEPATFTPRERQDDTATTDELLERLGEPGLVLLDARQPERWRGESAGLDPAAGRIPGALNAPSTTGRLPGLPPEALAADEVVAYCGSGVLACVPLLALHRAGRDDARLYPGSWSEWSRKGLPVEKG